jgi:predicted small metal-binding protein
MADKVFYSVNCSDGGAACDFHVCSSEESEVIKSAQEHAKRAHGMDVSDADIRKLMKSKTGACA